MRIITILFLLIGLSVSNIQAANVLAVKDPFEKRYVQESKKLPDQKRQRILRQNRVWKTFLEQHGSWYVSFDELSGMPHRASGQPIVTGGSNGREAAINFVKGQLSGYEVPVNDLKFQTENFSGKYINVFYSQQYLGIDILNSHVFVKLTPDYKVATFGLDVFQVNALSTSPALSAAQAVSFATNDLSLQIKKVSTPVLKILPFPINGIYEYRLVYELTVNTSNENKLPGSYYSLVDANTGEIIYRQNRVRFSQPFSSDVAVTGSVSLYSPYQPAQILPMRNLIVNDGSSIQYTDTLGEVNLTGAGSVSATFTLDGLWSRVFTDAGSVSPTMNASFNPGQSIINFDSVTNIPHISGYYHVNVVHDFMKTFFPTFTSLDFPLPTRIEVTGGFCNAYYGGSEINFFESGGGCNCMAQIGDVVYHEYGHGINDLFYQSNGGSWDNGGMGEGYADVWGFSITQSPILGPGYEVNNANSFIRRYNINKKVYPQDLTGEVHDDGEIIAGAWYDVSLNLGSWADMTSLFASTYYDLITGPDGTEGQVYTDILLSALNQDDDDGNLANGTPHDNAILAAFELHGISLLNNVDIEHNEVLTSAALSPIVVNASMTSQYPWYTIDVRLNYKVDSGTWMQIPMSPGSSGNYSALIPGQPAGSLISYYLESFSGGGTSISTNPQESNLTLPNIPYFILVDYLREVIEDFDSNQTAGWMTGIPTDNATSGYWIIDTPVPSYETGGAICQTDQQHTPGGIQCAVTGNALSSTLSVGNSDVDGGRTTLQSPLLDISAYSSPVLSYWRWYTNDQGSTPRTDSWRTYISNDGVNFVIVEDLKIPDHSWRRYAFKVHDIIPGATQIMLRFVADDANSGSLVEAAVDDIEILDVDLHVSVNELDRSISLAIYPNPASTQLNFEFQSPASMHGSLEIFNSLGQVIYSDLSSWTNGLNRRSIDVSNLANGIYNLVLRNENGAEAKVVSILHD